MTDDIQKLEDGDPFIAELKDGTQIIGEYRFKEKTSKGEFIAYYEKNNEQKKFKVKPKQEFKKIKKRTPEQITAHKL